MNFLLKFKKILSEKRLIKTLKKKLYPYLKGFFYFFSLKKSRIDIFVSKVATIDKTDLPLAHRIFSAFKLMKVTVFCLKVIEKMMLKNFYIFFKTLETGANF